MAILKSNLPIGKISGKLGNLVFRVCNNKTVVSKRPINFKPGSDPASVQRRLRFKTTSGFSKTVLKLNHIREIWKKEAKNMSVYNTIFKYNYHQIFAEDVSDNVTFFPKYGFELICESILFDEDGFIIKVKASDSALPSYAKFIKMSAVLLCKNPIYEHDLNIDFEEFNSNTFSISKEMIIKIFYNDFMKEKYKSYTEFKLFVGFSLFNEDKVFVHHSNTYRVK